MITNEQNYLGDLANYIYDFCGIDYKNNLNNLKMKIEARIKELGLSVWEYFGYIKMEPEELDVLIELITVNETYFFREENLLEEFKNSILPEYINSANNNVRIWSAACSTGEEPYTIGMLIEDSGLFKDHEVQIIATDINKRVLEKAKKGLYKKNSLSFRRTTKDVYDKFFIDHGEYYKVKDEITKMVEFKRINLLDNDLEEKIGKCDIIFCRNVLIYFDEHAIRKIINGFYRILNPGGYLLLGHAESITGIHSGFEVIHKPSVFYYKRKG